MQKKQFFKKGFTLVELIIVIAIIAILAVTAFLLLTKWLAKARDSSRASDLASLQSSLQIYLTESSKLPMPESYATINSSGTTLGYQGVFGESSKDAVGNISIAPKDPNDKEYYLYYVDATYKKYQVGAFNENELSYNSNSVNAVDYSKRYFNTKGDKLGILLDSNQTPINQSLTGLDVSTGTTTYTAYFDSINKLSGTGQTLQWLRSVVNNGGNGFDSPKDCPTGFIPVPGNKDFNQPGFCVAKYEMKQINGTAGYATGHWPTFTRYTGNGEICTKSYSCGGNGDTGAKTVLDGKITSKADGYPIVRINSATAVQACKAMGNGYHLITNNEWMTIARNAEQQSSNRSGGINVGYIFNGNNGAGLTGMTYPSDVNDNNGCSNGLGGLLSGCNQIEAGNNQRTLKLSNGQIIWDLAGNVRENVNGANTVNGDGFNKLNGNFCNLAGWALRSWCDFSINGFDRNMFGSLNRNLTTSNGVGNIALTTDSTPNKVFRRGSCFYEGGAAGLYTLGSGGGDSDSAGHIGFRCAR